MTEPQGPVREQKKVEKIVRPQCLDAVATTHIVKWQLQTTLYPENMITLSRKNCRVPSSAILDNKARQRKMMNSCRIIIIVIVPLVGTEYIAALPNHGSRRR